MCSKREEQSLEEEEAAAGYNQNTVPSAVLVQHQNMQQLGSGMNIYDHYSSYTSSSSSQVSSHQQLPQHPGYIPDPLAFPAAGDQYLFPPPPSYGGLFNRRVPGGYEGSTSSSDLRLISETVVGHQPFGLNIQAHELIMGGKMIMSAQEMMDAKALAASKSHSEAERRRRERINNHLAKLRTLLPSTTKTDKASLLAEVIQHVKELKRQTSIIAEQSPVPTETDELTIDNVTSDEQGNLVIRASLCCEDRSDLLPDLIKTLKALRLRTLKAEITTLGGRMKNVLFITGDHNDDTSINMIQEAFKAVMEKTNDQSSSSVKRQRTNNIN